MAENMVRLSSRIGKDLDDWMNEESKKTGVPKSVMVHLALENYKREKQAFNQIDVMHSLAKSFEELKGEIEKIASVQQKDRA